MGPVSRCAPSRVTIRKRHSGATEWRRNPQALLLRQFLADVLEREEFFLDFFDVQQLGVAGVELGERVAFRIALAEVLVVVEAALVARHAVEVTKIDGMSAFLVREERFVHLFAVTDADDLDGLFIATEEFADRLCLSLYCASRSLLHQDVAARAVLESEQHQVHRLVQTHDESRHGTFGNGYRLAGTNLVNPQRNHGPATAHHVPVACTTNLCLLRAHRAGFRHNDLFHHGLARAHGVHRVGRLVGAEADHILHTFLNRRRENIVRTEHVRLHGLQREEFATRHLLERRRMEDVVHPMHRVLDALQVTHVADVELDLLGHVGHLGLELVAHIILFFLVAAEYADFTDISLEETIQHSIAKATRAAGDKESFICKNEDIINS